MLALADWSDPLKVAILTATLLTAAVLGIRIARIAHVPRVVGYLILGIVLRFAFEWFAGGPEALKSGISSAMVSLDLLKSLALSLILFAIGAEFDIKHLKAVGEHIWKLSLAEILIVSVCVFGATWMLGGFDNPVQAVFLATAAIATAPAATLLVLRQYGSKGPLTDHILAMTGINNFVAIVLFYVAFLFFAEVGAIHTEHMDYGLVRGILLASVGSMIIGFGVGLLLSLVHVALTRFEAVLIFFGIMLAVSALAKHLGLNSLIVAMFMGVAFTNFSIQPHRLRTDLEPICDPIFALFFTIAGFSLEPRSLWHVGLVGVAFLVARAVGKIMGASLGVRWMGTHHRVSSRIGTAMLCQAGVAIGLGKYLVEHWGWTVGGTFVPDPGALAVNTVILASVAFFELIGPLATKRAVVRAGEVKAITLLVRPGGSMREMATVVSRLRRALSTGKASRAEKHPQKLTARYVMRTNIHTLRETAKMAEVLRFVESSRLNHFFVVDNDGNLVGTINFSDLRNLMFNPTMAQLLTAYDMANTAPLVVLADQPLNEILDLFHRHDVGSLPVIESLESHRFLGVVEQRDVLRALHVSENDDDESAH